MATIGFLLDPDRDIPSSQDSDWFGRCTAFMSGTWMAWQKLKSDLDQADLPNKPWFEAPSLTTNAADYMSHMSPEHKRQYDQYVNARHSQWLQQGKPDTQETGGPADFEAWSGQPSKLSVDKFLGYRGLKAAKAKQGKLATVHHDSDPFGFNLSPTDSVELAMLAEIARANGGTHLALWTYGHSLQIVIDRPTQHHWFSIRLHKPSDQARPDVLTQLKAALDGSRLKPDWKAIEHQLSTPSISITRWFLAFGIPGAMELVPAQANDLWSLLESEGSQLLTGQPVDPTSLKALNKYLTSKLPSKGGKGTARKLSNAATGLARLIGWGALAARQAWAEQYWTIVDGPLHNHLTTGANPKGQSASTGRLLSYYQGADLRDGLFLSLAAAQAESANGHAYVAALEVLAENCNTVGCSLVIFPQALQNQFRSAFGIEDGAAESDQGWSAELFLDLPGLLKADLVKEALAFLKKNRCKGAVLRVEPGLAVTAHGDFAELFPKADLSSLGGSLSAAQLAQALGLSLFRPPAIQETPPPSSGLTRQAVKQGRLGPQASLQLRLGTSDPNYLDQLLQDLGEFFPLRWIENGTLFAGSQSPINPSLLHQLLGDLPRTNPSM